jgi:hypothetical protein
MTMPMAGHLQEACKASDDHLIVGMYEWGLDELGSGWS